MTTQAADKHLSHCILLLIYLHNVFGHQLIASCISFFSFNCNRFTVFDSLNKVMSCLHEANDLGCPAVSPPLVYTGIMFQLLKLQKVFTFELWILETIIGICTVHFVEIAMQATVSSAESKNDDLMCSQFRIGSCGQFMPVFRLHELVLVGSFCLFYDSMNWFLQVVSACFLTP